MTTETLRRDTKSTDAERRHTADMARLGEIERGERMSGEADALERMAELFLGGRYADSRAMHRREFERSI